MFNTTGEEINRVIAEKVMGLNVVGKAGTFRDPECGGYHVDSMHKGPFDKYVYVETCMCKEEWAEQDPKICGHHAFCLEVVPDYYENIADAMKVADKFRQKFGAMVTVRVLPENLDVFWDGNDWQKASYSVTISGGRFAYDHPGLHKDVYGNVLSQTICQAIMAMLPDAVETVKEQEK